MADEAEIIDWIPEEIPKSDKLYMRVHRMYVKDGDFGAGAFRDQAGAMSTDWEKYSSPSDTRNRAKKPTENGIVEMVVGKVSQIPGLRVAHTPDIILRVRAHTDVIGEKSKDPEVRVKLKRASQWCQGFKLV